QNRPAGDAEATKYARSLEEQVGKVNRDRVALEIEVKDLKAKLAAAPAASGGPDPAAIEEAVAAVRSDFESEKTALEGQLAQANARLQEAEARPAAAGSSKAPLFLGLLFLVAGLALCGIS